MLKFLSHQMKAPVSLHLPFLEMTAIKPGYNQSTLCIK